MSTKYQITKKIHEAIEIKKVAITQSCYLIDNTGLIEHEQKTYHKTSDLAYGCVRLIEEPQIRQILLALQEELGENPDWTTSTELQYTTNENTGSDHQLITDYNYFMLTDGDKPSKVDFLYQGYCSYSKALCKKWLDGLTPLFDTDPIAVLTELLEILTKLLNQ